MRVGGGRLIAGEGRLDLVELRLGGPAVELEEDVAGFNELAVLNDDLIDHSIDAGFHGDGGDGLDRTDRVELDCGRLTAGDGDFNRHIAALGAGGRPGGLRMRRHGQRNFITGTSSDHDRRTGDSP